MNDQDPARVQRLEEAQGFTERAIEQLSEEIQSLNRRMAVMQAMLKSLETRLTTMSEPPEEPEE